MTNTPLSIAIIGAGATGIAAAWDFAKAGHHVEIYEAGAEVGGLAAGFKLPGWEWHLEKFYHHWFETDKDIQAILEEMGLWENVVFPRPKTSYWIDGKTYRSEISPSALFLPVSPLATARMGAWGAFLKLKPDGLDLEGETAHNWMLSHMGQEAYNKFFRPLLIGKFGERYQQVNMAWMWARIRARSLRLGIYKGGFQAALDAMARAVQAAGAVNIHLNTRVDGIQWTDGQPTLIINGERKHFDRVLTTTSPQLLLKMVGEPLRDTPYGQQVAGLESIGAVCVVLALEQSLLTDGTYWLNLPATSADKHNNQFPFLALVEHTNWLPKAHFGDNVIVYCGDYMPVDHEYFTLSDEEITRRFVDVLHTFNPDFRKTWVKQAWVFRAPYAQPVPGINHSKNIPPLKTPIPGLYWASMSQVYPWDRGTNFAVEMGRRAAREMMEE
ncbi:MAG: NAD(P)/FAD-dependent oxidoreductase [Chloroflexi bacterium AL-W]|nr:NAD(P)/FAD-dependent oxidoreductase [Chloroflexi bacterium AL-W]